MSFDSHSLERLRQLGRTLPQPLPQPQETAERDSAAASASSRRHRVETETNPEALFRELMQVSPDGSVPPHLMDRLRQAEALQQQQQQRRPSAPPAATTSQRQRGVRQAPQDEHQDLYTAFQQLLLEDEGED